MDFDSDEFEMVVNKRGHSGRGASQHGFKLKPTPSIRFALHTGNGAKDTGKQKKQFSICLNNKVMEMARFVAGDKVNILFNKDKSMLKIERHPAGQWTLSPNSATKSDRVDAIGKPRLSSIKFTAPPWAETSSRLQAGFVLEQKDICIEGSRVIAQVNL